MRQLPIAVAAREAFDSVPRQVAVAEIERVLPGRHAPLSRVPFQCHRTREAGCIGRAIRTHFQYGMGAMLTVIERVCRSVVDVGSLKGSGCPHGVSYLSDLPAYSRWSPFTSSGSCGS